MCVFMSCDKTVKYDDNLLFAMKLLEENPDSSYSILESITTPQKMSQRDYALYFFVEPKLLLNDILISNDKPFVIKLRSLCKVPTMS